MPTICGGADAGSALTWTKTFSSRPRCCYIRPGLAQLLDGSSLVATTGSFYLVVVLSAVALYSVLSSTIVSFVYYSSALNRFYPTLTRRPLLPSSFPLQDNVTWASSSSFFVESTSSFSSTPRKKPKAGTHLQGPTQAVGIHTPTHLSKKYRFPSRVSLVEQGGLPTETATKFGIRSGLRFSLKNLFHLSSSPRKWIKMSGGSSDSVLTHSILKQQDASTSNTIIHQLQENPLFQKLAQYEGQLILHRDADDDEKLQQGIDFAKSKQVIDPNYVPQPYHMIHVESLSPNQVATQIWSMVEQAQHESNAEDKAVSGSVIVLVGLSGTGKGTTVSMLRRLLESQYGKQVVTWSNGNVFRSLTLLAATWWQQQSGETDSDLFEEKALTKENLQQFMSMLQFVKRSDTKSYDIHIKGLGVDSYVNDIQNTILKSPMVSKNIPTVAKYTQGEVILFASAAVDQMSQDGMVVLFEGREQTVNYVRTPHRFTLVLSDPSLIGKRRAAQRLMAMVQEKLASVSEAGDDLVSKTLLESLDTMVKDVPE
jgi:energy-coupling factor transporter ATP-binding protein EcfA2